MQRSPRGTRGRAGRDGAGTRLPRLHPGPNHARTAESLAFTATLSFFRLEIVLPILRDYCRKRGGSCPLSERLGNNSWVRGFGE